MSEPLSPACAACPAPRGCFPAPCGLYWQKQAYKVKSYSVADLEQLNENVRGYVEHFRETVDSADKNNTQLEAHIKLLRDNLALVLPLAKGYAAEHPVGQNHYYCVEAEEALNAVTKQNQVTAYGAVTTDSPNE